MINLLHYKAKFSLTLADSYTTSELILSWMDQTPLEMDMNELSLPQFELLRHSVDTCEQKYKTGEQLTFDNLGNVGY